MYAFYLCARFVVEPANALLTHFSCKSEQKHALSRVQLKAIRHSGPRNRVGKYYLLRLKFACEFIAIASLPWEQKCHDRCGFIDPCKTRMVTLQVRLVSPADSVTWIQG